MDNQILLLKGHEIDSLLKGQEAAIIEVVGKAYQAHANKDTDMPPNGYLKFPDMEKERIIAKAAYLGADFQEAGLKWIASFPNNLSKGIERASASLILNSTETGRPIAFFESSIISAKRTAASAALAAKLLSKNQSPKTVGLVGCGLINFETLHFLLSVFPSIEVVHLLDLNEARAQQFKAKILDLNSTLNIVIQKDLKPILSNCLIISYGTTATIPHTDSLIGHLPNAVILHISLRDLTKNVILTADNVVDDIAQVCSNKTSLHLSEIQHGNRNFIRTTIGEILNETAAKYDTNKKLHIFSPFGLGILDLAVAHLVKKLAINQGIGTRIEDFLPNPWMERD